MYKSRKEREKQKILSKNEIPKQTTDNLTNGQLEIFYKLDTIQMNKIFYKFCLPHTVTEKSTWTLLQLL